MNKRLISILAAVLIPCAVLAERVVVDGVAGYVNDHVITIGEVVDSLKLVRQRLSLKYKGEELKAKLNSAYQVAVSNQVARYLILDTYNKKDAKLPDWVVEKRAAEIIHDNFNDDRSALAKALSRDGLSIDEWKKDIIHDGMVVSVMRNEFIDKNIKIAPGVVKQEYETNKEKFKVPAKVKLRMIVLKKGSTDKDMLVSRQKAETVAKKLEAGGDFAEAAKLYSEDDRGRDGGDYGWMQVSAMKPELAKAVESLKAGEVTPAVELEDEIYICKVDERTDEKVPTFEEAQERIERDLKMQEAEKMFNAWIDRLKRDAYIKVIAVEPFTSN